MIKEEYYKPYNGRIDTEEYVTASNSTINYIRQLFPHSAFNNRMNPFEKRFILTKYWEPQNTFSNPSYHFNEKSGRKYIQISDVYEPGDYGSNSNCVNIIELKDEYFIVFFNWKVPSLSYNIIEKNGVFKCDQIDGVKELLFDYGFDRILNSEYVYY